MKKWLLKHLLAAALGGAITAVAGAQIDPDHLGKSVKDLGKMAGSGAVAAVVMLNVRAPKDDEQ